MFSTNMASDHCSLIKLKENLRFFLNAHNINEAELARKTSIPQPTLHKILSGKTIDPRISTLKVLADYFDVSLDTLLGNNVTTSTHHLIKYNQQIPIISWEECIDASQSIKTRSKETDKNWVSAEYISSNAYGLISKPSMEPRFPRNTLLIINPDYKAKDGDFILVHYPKTAEGTLRIFLEDGPTKLLLSFHEKDPSPFDSEIKILGVLIQAVIKFL